MGVWKLLKASIWESWLLPAHPGVPVAFWEARSHLGCARQLVCESKTSLWIPLDWLDEGLLWIGVRPNLKNVTSKQIFLPLHVARLFAPNRRVPQLPRPMLKAFPLCGLPIHTPGVNPPARNIEKGLKFDPEHGERHSRQNKNVLPPKTQQNYNIRSTAANSHPRVLHNMLGVAWLGSVSDWCGPARPTGGFSYSLTWPVQSQRHSTICMECIKNI